MVLTLIYQTIVIVSLLSFSFGPSFFALINTSINHGFKTASLLALGVVLSDFLVCLIFIVFDVGATNLIHDEKNQRFMGLLAGIVLVVFGVLYFKRPIEKKEQSIEEVLPSSHSMIIKGFLLNSLNPAVWLLWLGNVTAISEKLNNSFFKMILYFSITLGLVLLVELAKASAANRLKSVLTNKTMRTVNYFTGVLLIIFGLVLIYDHYFDIK